MRSGLNDRFYVYVDYRLDTNLPFYVGKGQDLRVKLEKRNRYHERICKKYGHRREVLFGTTEEQFALQEEIRLIAELKTRDYLGGTNFTDGGEGTTGWIPSEETRKKIGLSNKGKTTGQPRPSSQGSKHPNFGKRKLRPTKKCLHCACEFIDRTSHKWKKYCSDDCKNTVLAIARTGDANPMRKRVNILKKQIKSCIVCSKEFTSYVSQTTVICCSSECRALRRSQSVKRQWERGNIGKASQV